LAATLQSGGDAGRALVRGYSGAFPRRAVTGRLAIQRRVRHVTSPDSAIPEAPIRSRDELVAYLAAGPKPVADWRIGTEHEKFGFRLDDLRPPAYEGERGIGVLLDGLTRYGWERVQEGGRVIALTRDAASVSLEPAGQLELSGAPLETIHDTCREVGSHLFELKTVAD